MSQPRVYIIVLNYNSWKDTIECLESLFKLEYDNYQVVLIDNYSTDDSIQRLKDWSNGKMLADLSASKTLSHLSEPAVEKPIPFSANFETDVIDANSVIFLDSSENLGYAGGNNLGIKYGLKRGDADFFWILNNDTVVPSDCLQQLVKQFGELRTKSLNPGVMGSKLLFYDEPEMLQGVGSNFNKFTSKISQIGTFESDNGQYDSNDTKIDFVIGASIFVSREMVEKTGLMPEEYFLYNEEIDWCFQAKKKGFTVTYASESVIYHKQGASTKNTVKSKKKNLNAMFYQFRNIILFYKKFFPGLIFIPMSIVSLRIIKYALSDDFKFLSLLYPVLTLKRQLK